MNAIWLLNDSFSIKVEYNEYAPRIPLVHQYPRTFYLEL